jgi:predicted amidohydrolase
MIHKIFILLAVILFILFHRVFAVKCAIVQFSDANVNEVTQDANRLEAYVRTAAGNGAKIIVAPENCLYRYDPWDQGGVTALELANSFSGLVTRFGAVCDELNVCLVFGTREPSGDGSKPTYQSAVFIDDSGNRLKTYRKRVPSNSESGFTKSGGNDWTPFDTPYGKVFMQVCKDMDGDGYVNSMPTNIDLFIGINKDNNRGWVKVDAGCAKAGCYGIGVNWAGASGTIGGNSGFCNPQGNMISEAGNGAYGANQVIIYEDIPLTPPDPPVFTSISVSPAVAAVAPGGTRQFTGSALDQYGASMSSPSSFSWTVSGGGTINGSGLFTAGNTEGGPWTVTASSGGKSGTSKVTVSTVTELEVTNISVSGYSLVQNLQNGSTAYNDRAYTIESVPAEYLGVSYIQTANDDKASTGSSYMDAVITVALDDRVTPPSWMSGYTDSGDNLTVGGTSFSLHTKLYSTGSVALGGNNGGSASMYLVIFGGTASNPDPDPDPDPDPNGDALISIVLKDKSAMDPGPWLSSGETGDNDKTKRPKLTISYTSGGSSYSKTYQRDIGGNNPLTYWIATDHSEGNFYDRPDGTQYRGFKYGDAMLVKGTKTRVGFFQCNISDIPANAQITAVKFEAFVEPAEGRSGDGTIGVYQCTAGWTKTSITKSITGYLGNEITDFSVTSSTFVKGSWWSWDWDSNLIAHVQGKITTGTVKSSTRSVEQALPRLSVVPNPFNTSTVIALHSGENNLRLGKTAVRIYNSRGGLVASDLQIHADRAAVTWDAADFPSGVYFVNMTVNSRTLSKRVMLLK